MKKQSPGLSCLSPKPEGFYQKRRCGDGIHDCAKSCARRRNYIAPSDRLNIAAVGAAGKGSSDIQSVAHENIYAICDIDDRRLADTLQQDFAAPFRDKTKTYRDYREMLDSEPEIDAVLISTPDHMHAPIAMHAMGLGKHVYVQKPLCHTVNECRVLARAAETNNIVTQMGNQGHAGEGARLINEWVASGALGEIRKCTAGPTARLASRYRSA